MADTGIVKGRGGAWHHAKQGALLGGSGMLLWKFWIIHSISCNLVQSGSKTYCYCGSAQRLGLRTHVYEISLTCKYSMIMSSDVAHSLAALSRRLELHSTTPGQNLELATAQVPSP